MEFVVEKTKEEIERKKKIEEMMREMKLTSNELISGMDFSEENIEEMMREVLRDMESFVIAKNRKYKSASFDSGILGNRYRQGDKQSRFVYLTNSIITNTNNINLYDIYDTCRDQFGYGLIGMIICLYWFKKKQQIKKEDKK